MTLRGCICEYKGLKSGHKVTAEVSGDLVAAVSNGSTPSTRFVSEPGGVSAHLLLREAGPVLS